MEKNTKIIIKPIILIIFLSFVLFPTIALATWWNPFTWDWSIFNVSQSQNSVVASTTFYTQLKSNVRSCGSLNCGVVGTYTANASFSLPYSTVNDLPKWVRISYQDSSGKNGIGYINKINLGLNQVVINNSNISTASQTPAPTSNIPPAQNQTQQQNTPPANSTLCNGTYYTNCTAGNDFVCPSSGGAAYCQPQPNKNSSQITALEQQIINIKQQYYTDSQTLQNGQTTWQQQANAQLQTDQGKVQDLQNEANQLEGNQPMTASSLAGQAGTQISLLESEIGNAEQTVSYDLREVALANQGKQVALQTLLSTANQQIAQINLQIQQLQLQQ